MTISTRKKFVHWLVMLALSATLLFAMTETMLRLFAGWAFAAAADCPLVASDVPGLHYRLRPNYSSAKVTTDAQGFRLRPPDTAKPRLTVLILGDSIAFSNGLAYEKSFTPILEHKLSAEMGEPVAVWNAAAPGYNTEQEAIQLDVVAPRVAPDLVVVEFCMNDYLDPPHLTPNGMLDATGSSSRESGFSPLALLATSRTIIFGKEKLKDIEQVWPELFPRWAHYLHYVHNKPGWQRAKQALLRIQRATQARNARMLLVVFPMEQQLRVSERAALDDLAGFARANGIASVDLYDAFQPRWREGLYLNYWKEVGAVDKLHLNDRGHEIAASEIASAILGRHLLLTKNQPPAHP
jgi:lysophospholipase L1-like esterase